MQKNCRGSQRTQFTPEIAFAAFVDVLLFGFPFDFLFLWFCLSACVLFVYLFNLLPHAQGFITQAFEHQSKDPSCVTENIAQAHQPHPTPTGGAGGEPPLPGGAGAADPTAYML